MKTIQYFVTLSLLVWGISQANAQSTTTPGSVCAGATSKLYKVTSTPGNTYHWSITGGGSITTSSTSDSILIDWSSTPGTDTIKVVEANAIGCMGDTVVLAVVRIPLPTVALSGTDSICQYSSTFLNKLTFTFTGLAPWTVSYQEDGATRSVTTSTNPYTFNSQVYSTSGVKNYSVNSVSGRLGCVGTKSGAAAVTVFSKPSTSAIIHY